MIVRKCRNKAKDIVYSNIKFVINEFSLYTRENIKEILQIYLLQRRMI